MARVSLVMPGLVRKGLKPYQKARLTSFLNPDKDPKGSGYQIRQSLIAVGDGGIWGRGATKGTQTQGDFLPIPYTDFIFAAFCEEHGFVGAVVVLLLYFLILMRLIQNAQTAADLSGTFLIMGVVAVLDFSDRGQRRNGHRADASHRNSFTFNELRRILGIVHFPGSGHGDECPDEPIRELEQLACGQVFWSEVRLRRRRCYEVDFCSTLDTAGQVDHRAGQD